MALILEAVDKRFYDYFDANQDLEVIADASHGLEFTEGPIWNKEGKHLTFSDIAGNKMYRYSEEEGVKVFVAFSFKANGNTYAPDGSIVTCEHATSRISKRDVDGKNYKILADKYEELELNSPNDIVVKSDNSIYFTDPHFGRNPSRVGVEREQQLSYQGVFMFKEGKLVLLDTSMQDPNGLCFSHDEKKLFVNDTPRCEIKIFDVNEDGTISNGKVWAKTIGDGPGKPDGMKLDANEDLYCCAQGGLHVFTKEAEYLGRVVIPVQSANFCFGGDDGKDIYVCATDRVYKFKSKKSGW